MIVGSPHLEPRPTTYSVCALPADHPAAYEFTIKVELTHHSGTWAVRWAGRCLSVAGAWAFEPLPSSREDDWLADHRFGLADALSCAVEAAPDLVVNGRRAAEFLAPPTREL